MTRQRRYQLRKISQGLCSICGNEKLAIGDYGAVCFAKRALAKRKASRKKNNSQPWKKGKPGRPPTEAA